MSDCAASSAITGRAAPALRARSWLTWLLYAAAALVLLPIISIFLIALTNNDGTLAHTLSVVLPASLRDTLLLLLGVSVLASSMGTITAWLVTAHEFPGRRILAWLLVLPMAIPTYIAAYIAVEVFEPLGPVQSAFRAITGYQSARDYWFPAVRSLPAATLIFSLVLYPYIYLSTRAMLLTQSASPLDAARILGASPARTVRKIAMPLARPAITAGLTLALLETLNDIGASEYLGVRTLALSIYTTWLNRHSLPGGAQIACVLLACVAVILFVEIYMRGTRAYMNSARASSHLQPRQLAGGWRWLATLACVLPVIAGFVVPVIFLCTRAWRILMRDGIPDDLIRQLGATLFYAGLSTALIVLTGLVAALAVRRMASLKKISDIACLGYAIPGTVLALGLLWPLAWMDQWIAMMWRGLGATAPFQFFIGTGAALVVAMTIRFLSIGIHGIANGFARIPRSMEDSARTLGAQESEILRRIQWPLLKPALAAAALIAFIDTAKELPATLLLRPLGVETLSTALYENAARGQFEDGTIHALLIVIIGVAAALYLARGQTRAGRGHGVQISGR
ncbi:MAG: ABC transporter permease [Beijerinckiaceae bacterium]